ncbi:MAG: chemotaxis protein CheR [Alphaproteobacteria bacterium RIFOXYD12_FULL_60_8]|nr:MAG: chemotaxis protein CheR [Alphaproteobacteria bacterium RIFOXYD12_FULL_60_8]
MTPTDFEYLAKLLKERSGLVLEEKRAYLLDSRLDPMARKRGLRGVEDLIKEIQTHRDEGLIAEVVDVMTTNESLFFRDRTPFQHFETNVLPELIQKRRNKGTLRIWSAACSTGQEPYSLSMILHRNQAALSGLKVEIVATDLSEEALERAKSGHYTQFEVQRGLPIELLIKHFSQDGHRWRINPELQNNITFRNFNLLHDFGPLGDFDVIFCRNVLIYFDEATKRDILGRMARSLADDGYLFLGATETMFGISSAFTPIREAPSIFRPAPRRDAAS